MAASVLEQLCKECQMPFDYIGGYCLDCHLCIYCLRMRTIFANDEDQR